MTNEQQPGMGRTFALQYVDGSQWTQQDQRRMPLATAAPTTMRK